MRKIHTLLPFLLISIFSVLVIGCGDFTSEQEALWDKLMEIHDISMENHSKMMNLGDEVRGFIDNSNLPPGLQYTVKPTMTQIDNADEAMMQWMSDLKGKFKVRDMEPEAITKYWTEELAKIEKIDKDIVSSTKAAVEFLAQAKKY